MSEEYQRLIDFNSVLNFRDLGGYLTEDGYEIAWRRIFRSGELHKITANDLTRMRDEIGPVSIISLKSQAKLRQREIELFAEAGVRRHLAIPFINENDDGAFDNELFNNSVNMGTIYLYIVRQDGFHERLVKTLELIAEPENHPLVFHCALGKDRTGVLAAVLLGILSVSDDDIIEDYMLTAPHVEEYLIRMQHDPEAMKENEGLPDYVWKSDSESMSIFLSGLRQEYGSVRAFAESSGVTASCISRLKHVLLV